MGKDIHANEFHPATKEKLKIVESYLKSWLPVFVMSGHEQILIGDLFAGSGFDSKGNEGSPLIMLRCLQYHEETILNSKIKNIFLVFNEYDKEKFEELKHNIDNLNLSPRLKSKLVFKIKNNDFAEFWPNFNKFMRGFKNTIPSFLLLDQYGIKHVTDDVFVDLCKMPKCDFTFFMSSSFFKRFGKRPEFRNKFPKLDIDKISNSESKETHSILYDYYKNIVTCDELQKKIYPYSLKKDTNYYGLIMGSEHPAGIQKIVEVLWDMDPLNGSANFDLHDDDYSDMELFTFSGYTPKPTRRDTFAKKLEKKILNKELQTNEDVYHWALRKAFLPKHATDAIRTMKENKLISYKGHTCISYDSIKKGKTVHFEVLQ